MPGTVCRLFSLNSSTHRLFDFFLCFHKHSGFVPSKLEPKSREIEELRNQRLFPECDCDYVSALGFCLSTLQLLNFSTSLVTGRPRSATERQRTTIAYFCSVVKRTKGPSGDHGRAPARYCGEPTQLYISKVLHASAPLQDLIPTNFQPTMLGTAEDLKLHP